MNLRALIADDEALSRARLRELIEREADIQLVAECANGKEAVDAIRANSPDLVFLDIKMPELDGFGVINAVRAGSMPAVIFVTAHDEFAVRAFEVHAVDYLLKPFDRERFQTALRRARTWLQRDGSARDDQLLSGVLATLQIGRKYLGRIPVKSQGRIAVINTDEIDWICAASNYVELHVGKQCHLLRSAIKTLAEQLPDDQFIQISRSHMVNLERIKEVRSKPHGDFEVLLRDNTTVPGSRSHRDKLRRLLGEDP